jgi:hypothetical protein
MQQWVRQEDLHGKLFGLKHLILMIIIIIAALEQMVVVVVGMKEFHSLEYRILDLHLEQE